MKHFIFFAFTANCLLWVIGHEIQQTQLVTSVSFIKDRLVECNCHHFDCLEVPASYQVVPLTRTDKHLLITVKISLSPSDDEEMTCSVLQMQSKLKNKPRCG